MLTSQLCKGYWIQRDSPQEGRTGAKCTKRKQHPCSNINQFPLFQPWTVPMWPQVLQCGTGSLRAVCTKQIVGIPQPLKHNNNSRKLNWAITGFIMVLYSLDTLSMHMTGCWFCVENNCIHTSTATYSLSHGSTFLTTHEWVVNCQGSLTSKCSFWLKEEKQPSQCWSVPTKGLFTASQESCSVHGTSCLNQPPSHPLC